MSFLRPQIEQAKIGYRYRLSAPGYLDCTEWSKAPTIEKAVQGLIETYSDGFDLADWAELSDFCPEIADFLTGYWLAVGFTAIDSSGEPIFQCSGEFSDHYSTDEIIEKAENFGQLADFYSSVILFYNQAQSLGYLVDCDLEKAGADFHYSRNGHGTGFWDSGFNFADELQALSKRFGELELMS